MNYSSTVFCYKSSAKPRGNRGSNFKALSPGPHLGYAYVLWA